MKKKKEKKKENFYLFIYHLFIYLLFIHLFINHRISLVDSVENKNLKIK